MEMSLPMQFMLLLLGGGYGGYGAAATLVHNAAALQATPLPQRISPEIVNELKDFIGLIPAATVDEIVAKHLILDGGFRTALKYLRSSEFVQLQRQLQQIPEIIEILAFLHLSEAGAANAVAEVEVEVEAATCAPPTPLRLASLLPQLERALDLDNVVAGNDDDNDNDDNPPQLEIVLLDANTSPGLTASATAFSAAYDLHSFSSFVAELVQHLPRDSYVQMINAKLRQSPAFAAFYAALRGAQLRPMVQAAMQATNLANVIKTLSGHSIDVKSLEPIAFQVISWGPAI